MTPGFIQAEGSAPPRAPLTLSAGTAEPPPDTSLLFQPSPAASRALRTHSRRPGEVRRRGSRGPAVPPGVRRRRSPGRPRSAPPPRRAPATHTCPQGTCTGFSNTSRHTGHVKRLRGSVSDAGFADGAAPSQESACAAAILPLRSVAQGERAAGGGGTAVVCARARTRDGRSPQPTRAFESRRPPGV